MTDDTPLDRAHAAMEAAPGDDAAQLAFYDCLAGAELFLLLQEEAEGDRISPEVFGLETGPVVLAFDREDRLAAFLGRPAAYAALSGRRLAAMLAGQGLGLGLNLDVAPSAMLLPVEAVDWLAAALGQGTDAIEARIDRLSPPQGLPEAVLTALDRKLSAADGLARAAYLAGVDYVGGGAGHLLAFIDALPGAEAALTEAVAEALSFSGIEAGSIDVVYLPATGPVATTLARVGLRFDLPQPVPVLPAAPGSDPERPPRLR